MTNLYNNQTPMESEKGQYVIVLTTTNVESFQNSPIPYNNEGKRISISINKGYLSGKNLIHTTDPNKTILDLIVSNIKATNATQKSFPESLTLVISKAANEIASKTLRGPGNILYIPEQFDYSCGIDTISVIKTPHLTNYAVLIYKGSNEADSAFIYDGVNSLFVRDDWAKYTQVIDLSEVLDLQPA